MLKDKIGRVRVGIRNLHEIKVYKIYQTLTFKFIVHHYDYRQLTDRIPALESDTQNYKFPMSINDYNTLMSYYYKELK